MWKYKWSGRILYTAICLKFLYVDCCLFFFQNTLGGYYEINSIYSDPLSTTPLEFYLIVFWSNGKMGTDLTRQNDAILVHSLATVQTPKEL